MHWWLAAWCLGCGSTADPSVETPEGQELVATPDPVSVEVAVDATHPDLPAPTERRYGASHILIGWMGAARSTASRSEADAEALAQELHDKVAGGEDLAALAKVHSDGPSGPRGGSLGVYATGTMVPSFERVVASVGVGELAPLVKTPFGWHIVRRDAVLEARAAHILVTWDGAWRSKQTRSRDEARSRAEEARAALAKGRPFADVAARFSDDARTAERGGDLGLVAPGQFLPPFEEALFALEPGAVSDVVESAYGFHLVQRLDED